MEYQLIVPNISSERDLTAVEQVLLNRGIALENIDHYLNTTNADILNPELIMNIYEGAQMLIKHIASNDKILIQVDSDCDGYTSAATLINYLNYLFPGFTQSNILYRIHTGKQHGILLETIPEDIKMVIAPDSSRFTACKFLFR